MSRISLALAAAGTVLLIGACSDSTTQPSPSTSLVQVVPQGGSTGVASDSPLMLEFGSAMGTGMEQFVDLHQGPVTGPVVPMTCAWSGDRTVLTCAPNTPLQGQTDYTMHVGAGMTDANGRAVMMEQPGMGMGGHVLTGGMMGGMHAGQDISAMGSGWRDADGHLGLAFPFTTN
jgi:hypothetical protein